MSDIGSAQNNRWRVADDKVDMTRRPAASRPVELDAEPRNVVIDLARTAILVLDMQNDFCHPEGRAAQLGGDVGPARRPIEPLQRLLPALRDAGASVVWVNWGNRPDRLNLSPSLLASFKRNGEGIGIGDPLPEGGAPVLEKDSWDSAIVAELETNQKDVFVDKYRISGFWDTPLDSILRNLGVTTLLFAGVNADQCVMCTLQDANFLGYDCLFVEDCTATSSPDFCMQATLYNVKRCFGFVTRADAVVSAIEG